jgi:hypothetical protein
MPVSLREHIAATGDLMIVCVAAGTALLKDFCEYSRGRGHARCVCRGTALQASLLTASSASGIHVVIIQLHFYDL